MDSPCLHGSLPKVPHIRMVYECHCNCKVLRLQLCNCKVLLGQRIFFKKLKLEIKITILVRKVTLAGLGEEMVDKLGKVMFS